MINAAAAHTVFNTENIGVLTALILAFTGAFTTIYAARAKAKLDDRARLQSELAEAIADRDRAKAAHAVDVDRYEESLTEVRTALARRDETINRLDERLVAATTRIARLRRLLANHDIADNTTDPPT